MKELAAMVLAGGRGRRMDILCHDRAKPSLPFAGRYRVIDFVLSNSIHSEIHEIAILTDYQRSSMADYLREWYLVNGSNCRLYLLEPKLSVYKGTADAVYQNSIYLWRQTASRVLVMAADHIYTMDYRKMLEFHERAGADVTIGVISVPIEEAHRFGVATVNAEGRITDFLEKPEIPPSSLASMGIYIFNKEVLLEHLTKDAARLSLPHDFGHAIIPDMVNRDRVFAYEFSGYWCDIGTIEAYYKANMELVYELPSFSLDGPWPVLTVERNLPYPNVTGPGNVKRSLISPGCVIKGMVENSILSHGVRIEEHAVVRNSIIMANTIVGEHSVITSSILDEEVNVGDFCHIGLGAGLISGSEDISVLGRGMAVPSYTTIGCNDKVMPNGVLAAPVTDPLSTIVIRPFENMEN